MHQANAARSSANAPTEIKAPERIDIARGGRSRLVCSWWGCMIQVTTLAGKPGCFRDFGARLDSLGNVSLKARVR